MEVNKVHQDTNHHNVVEEIHNKVHQDNNHHNVVDKVNKVPNQIHQDNKHHNVLDQYQIHQDNNLVVYYLNNYKEVLIYILKYILLYLIKNN